MHLSQAFDANGLKRISVDDSFELLRNRGFNLKEMNESVTEKLKSFVGICTHVVITRRCWKHNVHLA